MRKKLFGERPVRSGTFDKCCVFSSIVRVALVCDVHLYLWSGRRPAATSPGAEAR